MSVCPPRATLEAYAQGSADAETSEHVTSCVTCQAMLQMIEEENELFAEVLDANDGGDETEFTADAPPGYEITDEIHRGGQGVVLRAVQTNTRREVALKMLLLGSFATRDQRRRFALEAELIASFRHPHIVTVYDFGMTPGGRHFIAMELVHGAPLNEWYAQDDARSVAARLEVFDGICDAVAAAHRRGIIHRDIKPANIVVDDDDHPRVLDFGLAKTTTATEEEATLVTREGSFIGTFAYAAPEQVTGGAGEIDTRTDVYALGLVLYEMLTGHRAYQVSGSMADIVRIVTETIPPPPSTLRRGIDPDLDVVVMTALAKDPDRRYQTAQALLDDVRRVVRNEPIAARPDSTWYVLRKAMARHRAAVIAGATFVVLLIAFSITSLVLARQATLAHQATLEENRRVSAALGYLVQLFAEIDPENPDRGLPATTARALLERAEPMIERELVGLPKLEAAARAAIGRTYIGFREFETAEVHLARALMLRRELHDEDHPDLATSLHDYARVHNKLREFDEALEVYVEAYEMRTRLFGELHEGVAKTAMHIGSTLRSLGRPDEAIEYLRIAIDIQTEVLGLDHPETGNSLNGLGLILRDTGHPEEGYQRFKNAARILALQREDESEDEERRQQLDWRRMNTLHNAGTCLNAMKDFEEAVALLESVAADKHAYLRTNAGHKSSVARTEAALAHARLGVGAVDEALTAIVWAIAAFADAGPSFDHAYALDVHGRVLEARGDLATGVEQVRAAKAMMLTLLPPDHAQVIAITERIERMEADLARSPVVE